MINGLLRTTSGRAYRDGCSDRGHDRGTVADKQFGAIVTAIEGEVALPDGMLKHLRKGMTTSIKKVQGYWRWRSQATYFFYIGACSVEPCQNRIRVIGIGNVEFALQAAGGKG